jgi:acyl carrier protein
MSNVDVRVRETISKVLNIDIEQIKMESSFQEDLGSDSLEVVEVIIALEEEFSIDIPDERAERVTKVSEACSIIDEIIAMSE